MSTMSTPKCIDNLPLEVLHEIITYLDHDSRIDLIQTNKKFYQILIDLPKSLRITLDDIHRVELDDNTVTLYNEEWEISETLEDWHHVSKFMKVVKSKEYHLNILTEEEEQKYCQFLIDNREIIKFSDLKVNYVPDKISHYDLWREVLSTTDNITFLGESEQLLKVEARRQFESLILESLNISQFRGDFSKSFLLEYLKQCGQQLRFPRNSWVHLVEREAIEEEIISSLQSCAIHRDPARNFYTYLDSSLPLFIVQHYHRYFLHDLYNRNADSLNRLPPLCSEEFSSSVKHAIEFIVYPF